MSNPPQLAPRSVEELDRLIEIRRAQFNAGNFSNPCISFEIERLEWERRTALAEAELAKILDAYECTVTYGDAPPLDPMVQDMFDTKLADALLNAFEDRKAAERNQP